MKVGVGSYAFRWSVQNADRGASPLGAALRLLETAAACGGQVVQICENVPLEPLSRAELAAVGRRAADLGLVLEVGTKGSTPGHLRWHLDLCDQVNAKLLRVVPDDEEPAADLIATLRALTTRLQAREVVVAVENHFRLKPAELAQIIAAVDHPHVGICLDPLNSISQLIGPAEVVATLAPYALSVHVKDAVTARRGTGFCITGCPIGEGMVDIRGMVASLKQQRRSPNLVVESWMDPAQNPEATAVQEQQWTRQGISYLQGVI